MISQQLVAMKKKTIEGKGKRAGEMDSCWAKWATRQIGTVFDNISGKGGGESAKVPDGDRLPEGGQPIMAGKSRGSDRFSRRPNKKFDWEDAHW